jgi:hypothetical protein
MLVTEPEAQHNMALMNEAGRPVMVWSPHNPTNVGHVDVATLPYQAWGRSENLASWARAGARERNPPQTLDESADQPRAGGGGTSRFFHSFAKEVYYTSATQY